MADLRRTPHSEIAWNAIELADPLTVEKVQVTKLREQLDYLNRFSQFYQNKAKAAGVDLASLRTLDDLQEFPFTEKYELRDSLQAMPPLGKHSAADLSEISQVQASSGTTGSPTYVGLTDTDIDLWCEMGARALYANGFRPGDFMLHAFGMSKGFVGGIPVTQIARYMGIVDLPIGAEAGVERLLRVQNDFRPDTLIGTPNFLIHLAEEAPRVLGRAAEELGVRAMSIGGEPGGGQAPIREKLETLWGATSREMLGGTDLGCTFWGECAEGKGMHMLFPDLVIAELIDPVSGQVVPIKEGAEGEVVYTALGRQASPLLRFRSRDHVVVTGTDCPCGRTGYTIRCIGRTDDMLIVRGINVFPSAVQELVTEMMPRTTGHMKIVVNFEGHATQERLPLTIEYTSNLREDELSGLREDLTQMMRSALNFTPEITLVPEGSIPRPGPTKVKLIQRV